MRNKNGLNIILYKDRSEIGHFMTRKYEVDTLMYILMFGAQEKLQQSRSESLLIKEPNELRQEVKPLRCIKWRLDAAERFTIYHFQLYLKGRIE